MNRSTRRARLALSTAALALLVATASLYRPPGEAPRADLVTAAAEPIGSPSPTALDGEHTHRAAARARHAAAGPPVEALGGVTREERAAARAEEKGMAERNRQYLFESNILGLYAAAAEADEGGHPERAALLRRRAKRLTLRMQEETREG